MLHDALWSFAHLNRWRRSRGFHALLAELPLVDKFAVGTLELDWVVHLAAFVHSLALDFCQFSLLSIKSFFLFYFSLRLQLLLATFQFLRCSHVDWHVVFIFHDFLWNWTHHFLGFWRALNGQSRSKRLLLRGILDDWIEFDFGALSRYKLGKKGIWLLVLQNHFLTNLQTRFVSHVFTLFD